MEDKTQIFYIYQTLLLCSKKSLPAKINKIILHYLLPYLHEEYVIKIKTIYPILYRDIYFDISPYWYHVIEKMSKELNKFNIRGICLKQKYGQLRYYFERIDESKNDTYIFDVIDIIENAQSKCSEICERCGAVGYIKIFDG